MAGWHDYGGLPRGKPRHLPHDRMRHEQVTPAVQLPLSSRCPLCAPRRLIHNFEG